MHLKWLDGKDIKRISLKLYLYRFLTSGSHDHIEIFVNGAGDQLFFRQREGPWMPTLRLLHRFPFFLPMQQVDKGAIRFVLSGANIMCPGLTSPGAQMTPVAAGTVVAIMAEGKENALAIGITCLSTDNM